MHYPDVLWPVRLNQKVKLGRLIQENSYRKGCERRTYAEDAASQIPSLDETCYASVGSSKEPSSEYYCGHAV